MQVRYMATAALLSLSLSGAALAQSDMNKTPSQGPTNSTTMTSPNATGGSMSGVQARKLIGSNLKNANNETIGEVDSVLLDSDGKVRSVIVGVGGFLGMGERNVAVNLNALNIADGGDTVRTTLTKDQLKAMPEYQYSDKSYRGKMFNDRGVVTN